MLGEGWRRYWKFEERSDEIEIQESNRVNRLETCSEITRQPYVPTWG